jgi:hypothetical protein
MGIFKAIKSVVGRKAAAAEVVEAPVSVIDKLVRHMTTVPRDGSSLLIYMSVCLAICLAVVLALAQLEQVISKADDVAVMEETVGDSTEKVAMKVEHDDTEDESDSSKQPFDEPPTPTLSPPCDTAANVKGVDDAASSENAPSIPDMSKSPRKLLSAKAKSIGGSIRRLGSNEYTTKFSKKMSKGSTE